MAAPNTTIPNTRVSRRNEIFNSDQEDSTLEDEEANKRMEAMMNMVLVGNDQEEATSDEGQESMEDEEEEFAFRLFSTESVAKVSIKENDEETANALSQQIANQQQIDHDETDPIFLAQVSQASISYDDIMQQSLRPYPALQLPKRVIHVPTPDTSISAPAIRPKRKSKKRRDYEKAVKEGRIVPKPNMRDPNTPGGWPGYPGARNPCAIINNQPYRGNRGGRGGRGGNRGGRGSFRGRGGAPSYRTEMASA